MCLYFIIEASIYLTTIFAELLLLQGKIGIHKYLHNKITDLLSFFNKLLKQAKEIPFLQEVFVFNNTNPVFKLHSF